MFGTTYLPTLLDLLDSWMRWVGDFQAVAFRGACAALLAYRRWVGKRLDDEYPAVAARLDAQLATIADSSVREEAGEPGPVDR